MNKLRSPDTAPKDGSCFLADVGRPWLVLASYNESDNDFSCACLCASVFDGKQETYFESHSEKKIYGWLPIPELKDVKH